MFDEQQYKNDYNKSNYADVKWRIPKDKKQVLTLLSEAKGKSINRLITEAMEQVYNIHLGR